MVFFDAQKRRERTGSASGGKEGVYVIEGNRSSLPLSKGFPISC